MTNHTPAPWGITPADYSGEPVRITKHEDHPQGNLTICHCNPYLANESEANARLIAAAPDLLSALQEMMSVFQDHEQYDEESAEVVSIARAAIAKAKGEA